MRDRDEGRIAVLVEALDEALLQAITLDEVEFPFALAEKDSRRLPWSGQNPRRDDFKVVVEKIHALQVNALDDVHFAVVGHANGLADGKVGLRQDADRIDHQRRAFPMSDGMTVEGRIRVAWMRPSVRIDTTKPVAVGFA